MAKLTITIDVDNAAFEDDFVGEINKVLEVASERVEQIPGGAAWALWDSNGNNVGIMQLSE